MDVHGGGSRLVWHDLPDRVRRGIEGLLGSPVRETRSAVGGFSPGLASSLTLADGRVVFAKAVGEQTAPGSAELFRRERRNLETLGVRPRVSRLLGAYDDGDWVALVLEHVPGRPPHPSDPVERAAMVRAFEDLVDRFTPAPVDAPTFAAASSGALDAWSTAPDDRGARIDPWVWQNMAQVHALASRWRQAGIGETLVHGDLRADNMIRTPAGEVVIVDWTDIRVGASWLDWAMAVPSMCLFPGTPSAERLFNESHLADQARPSDVTSIVAAVAGYFLCSSVRPAVPALRAVRDFQRAQGAVAADWLRRRVEAGLV
ncbi:MULTISPECIES: aminoglycoside phosphotransferase family protein [Microbacterium]|uniref:aminoglycoside phosphotransferase family protein n=1 Tax=Microbacterium TaxID=33882 RepID=UPI001469C91A|nr:MULTISPECIES: aminoglycoside phosphotransferase family protein [Microbacterium]